MGPPRPLSRLFLSIETNITIFTTNNRKNAIQYTELGFEPTPIRT